MWIEFILCLPKSVMYLLSPKMLLPSPSLVSQRGSCYPHSLQRLPFAKRGCSPITVGLKHARRADLTTVEHKGNLLCCSSVPKPLEYKDIVVMTIVHRSCCSGQEVKLSWMGSDEVQFWVQDNEKSNVELIWRNAAHSKLSIGKPGLQKTHLNLVRNLLQSHQIAKIKFRKNEMMAEHVDTICKRRGCHVLMRKGTTFMFATGTYWPHSYWGKGWWLIKQAHWHRVVSLAQLQCQQ